MRVSSAKRRRPTVELTPLGRLLVYRPTKNIAGLRTDPRGTPDVTGRLSDSAPSSRPVHHYRLCSTVEEILIHSSVVASMPYLCSDDMSLL